MKVVLNENDNTYRIDKKITNISEFAETINLVEEQINIDDNYNMWFRGSSSQGYKLTPAQCREKYWIYNAETEYELVSQFIHKGRAFLKTNHEKKTTWDWLHVCQHYGIPTRLLDWTESAFIALYFAIENKNSKSPCVWVLNPIKLNKSSTKLPVVFYSDHLTRDDDDNEFLERYRVGSNNLPKNPIAFCPPYVDDRIRAQKGCFTIQGSKKNAIHELNKRYESPFLARIEISKSAIDYIRWELDVLGINTSDIYPDLDGLAQELKWQYGF